MIDRLREGRDDRGRITVADAVVGGIFMAGLTFAGVVADDMMTGGKFREAADVMWDEAWDSAFNRSAESGAHAAEVGQVGLTEVATVEPVAVDVVEA